MSVSLARRPGPGIAQAPGETAGIADGLIAGTADGLAGAVLALGAVEAPEALAEGVAPPAEADGPDEPWPGLAVQPTATMAIRTRLAVTIPAGRGGRGIMTRGRSTRAPGFVAGSGRRRR